MLQRNICKGMVARVMPYGSTVHASMVWIEVREQFKQVHGQLHSVISHKAYKSRQLQTQTDIQTDRQTATAVTESDSHVDEGIH